jgi:hypothetical protein
MLAYTSGFKCQRPNNKHRLFQACPDKKLSSYGLVKDDYSEHRKMRAKQQHVCKEMHQYTNNTNRKWFLSFSIE